MRNIGKSKVYVVSELSVNNEQWINPDFGSPELQTHYENIKRMVKEKTGRAMQEMCVGLARSAKGDGASHRFKSSCTRTRGIG